MEKKKIIVIVISVIAFLISILVIAKLIVDNNKRTYRIPEGSVLIEKESLLKDKTIGDIKLTDVLIYTLNGRTKYLATATNQSDKDIQPKLYVILYKDGQKIEAAALFNQTIKAKSTTKINITYDIDLTKSTKIEYELR